MDRFPPEIEFRATWRPYQARVLAELDQHLLNNRLHVIAAPGSGKTLLGLEVLLRLGKPTLVLAPTLTIRGQWVERFEEMFVQPGAGLPEWVSTDIKRPGLLTVATYQALHCSYAGETCKETLFEPEEENGEAAEMAEIIIEQSEPILKNQTVETLKRAGVHTIVVDEAHHLRAEWWRSLVKLIGELDEPAIVALTATPPYDVSNFEWRRYQELCGPIDAEIAVPELVIDGNLCPHQDYIYLNLPSEDERAKLDEFRANVEALRADICSNEEFITALESHPWLNFPQRHIEEILDDPEYFSSIAIFVNAVRGRVPEGLLEIMGLADQKLPTLDLRWLETLLTGRLYTDEGAIGEWDNMLKLIRERLSRIGAIDRRRVFLQATPKLDRMLVSSVNKLDSILHIAQVEHASLCDDLRMVILADYIRASEMPDSPIDIKPLNRIGVVPIFEKIRRECPAGAKLGILSGSLVVIPASSEQALRKLCGEEGIEDAHVNLHPLPHDSAYCRLVIERDVHKVVELVTKLFCAGEIAILVGTKSLLGEGWDAPAINTLVLASFVGSFMLSNQMRGRAIRSLPADPTKTANVWHLVCAEPGAPGLGADMETLRRRFRAFVGVSFTDRTIENGIDRMGLASVDGARESVDIANRATCELAVDRHALRQRWEEALYRSGPGRLVGEIATSRHSLPRKFVLSQTASYLTKGVIAGVTGFVVTIAGMAIGQASEAIVLPVALSIAGAATLPYAAKSLIAIAALSGDEETIRRLAWVLIRALSDSGHLTTPIAKVRLTTRGLDLSVACSLEGCTSHESSLFLDCMEELLSPIGNPRYLLARDYRRGKASCDDFYAVPTLLGQHKDSAKLLLNAWNRRVGGGELIYTRTIEGRKQLLKARSSALSVGAQRTSSRTSCWR